MREVNCAPMRWYIHLVTSDSNQTKEGDLRGWNSDLACMSCRDFTIGIDRHYNKMVTIAPGKWNRMLSRSNDQAIIHSIKGISDSSLCEQTNKNRLNSNFLMIGMAPMLLPMVH